MQAFAAVQEIAGFAAEREAGRETTEAQSKRASLSRGPLLDGEDCPSDNADVLRRNSFESTT